MDRLFIKLVTVIVLLVSTLSVTNSFAGRSSSVASGAKKSSVTIAPSKVSSIRKARQIALVRGDKIATVVEERGLLSLASSITVTAEPLRICESLLSQLPGHLLKLYNADEFEGIVSWAGNGIYVPILEETLIYWVNLVDIPKSLAVAGADSISVTNIRKIDQILTEDGHLAAVRYQVNITRNAESSATTGTVTIKFLMKSLYPGYNISSAIASSELTQPVS